MSHHAHPREVVRIMGGQIQNLRLTIAHHFKNRHKNGAKPVHSWIEGLRRVDAASGYSHAVRQCGAPCPHYRTHKGRTA